MKRDVKLYITYFLSTAELIRTVVPSRRLSDVSSCRTTYCFANLSVSWFALVYSTCCCCFYELRIVRHCCTRLLVGYGFVLYVNLLLNMAGEDF